MNDGDIRRLLLRVSTLNQRLVIYIIKTIYLKKNLGNNELINFLKKNKFHQFQL